METFLIKTVQLLLSLSILVIFHEFGHFIFARMFKVRVEKFYLFFDPWWNRLATVRRICEDFGNDRRIDGQRTNEPAAQTVGISVETGMAKAPNYGSGRCI